MTNKNYEIAKRKYDALESAILNGQFNIVRFTGTDDGGLGFLDQPDEWQNATAQEIESAKTRVLEIASRLIANGIILRGKKLAAVVGVEARKSGDNDAAEIADQVGGNSAYIRADVIAGSEA